MRATSRLTRPISRATTAERLLGSDHPLVRTAERRRALVGQSVAVGAVLFAGALLELAGLSAASLLIAATLVEAALACSLLLVTTDVRRQARELIIAGRDGLPLPAIQSERGRLVDPARRRRLARSIDGVLRMAEDPRWSLRGCRPLFRRHVVAAASPELTAVAADLREETCEPSGVAMTLHLLCEGDSALYGDDPALLRDTLRRIHRRLGGRT